jgi:hypothetical protein
MMKKILGLLIVFFIVHFGFGQDYQAEFQKYIQLNDTTKQLEELKEWKKANPKDPELFVGYFNYHIMKSKNAVHT